MYCFLALCVIFIIHQSSFFPCPVLMSSISTQISCRQTFLGDVFVCSTHSSLTPRVVLKLTSAWPRPLLCPLSSPLFTFWSCRHFFCCIICCLPGAPVLICSFDLFNLLCIWRLMCHFILFFLLP
jgi:hypothetical protein